MQPKKVIGLVLASTILLITGPSLQSRPVIPGQSIRSPGLIPRTAQFFGEDEEGMNEDEIFSTGMVPDETHANRGIHIPPQADLDLTESTASFEIDYVSDGDTDYRGVLCTETPPEAKAAFDYAANTIWAATIHSTVPIRIRACWASSLGSTLGYSSSGSAVNFVGAPEPDTYYSYSLADALHGADLEPTRYDIQITYNSQYPYYFGLDANPPEDEYDFVTLALHEICHGFNFFGIVYYNAETQQGFIGSDSGYHSIYDDFMYFYDRDGGTLVPLTSYTSPSIELGAILRSEDIWFLGDNAVAANGGNGVRMYAPAFWKSGSSYAHLDYDTFKDTDNSLMVYAMSDGYANHNTGAVTRGLLQDLGWPDRLVPYPPEIVWPSLNTFTDRVRVAWSLTSSTTYYEIYRDTEADPNEATLLTTANDSPYDDTTADRGIPYYYWVKACNAAGCSDFSTTASGMVPELEAPTNVNASDAADLNDVYITWDEPEGADYYKVYRWLFDDVHEASLIQDNVITNAYKDSPPAKFLYYYWVKACTGEDCSGYSEPDTGYIGPPPPTGLEASDGTDKNNVYLSWDPSPWDKMDYRVFRNTADSHYGETQLADNYDYEDLPFVDDSADYFIDYYYWVQACDPDDHCSYYSSSDVGFRARTAPEKPLGVTASDGLYQDRVHLYWSEPAYTDYYRIFRNTTNTTTGAIEMESGYPLSSYDDLDVVTLTTYYYFIKACNAEGCSSYSSSESGYAEYPNTLFIPLVQK